MASQYTGLMRLHQPPAIAAGVDKVYQARDTKLGRDVAIRILPDVLSGASHPEEWYA